MNKRIQRWLNPVVALGLLVGGAYGMKESGVGLALGIRNAGLVAVLTVEYEDDVIDRELALGFGSSDQAFGFADWEVVDREEIVARGYSFRVGFTK